MPADDLRALGNLQRAGDKAGRLLNFHLGVGLETSLGFPVADRFRAAPLSCVMSPPGPVLGSVVSVVTCGSIFRTTKVPWPGLVSTRPRAVSSLIASRTVFRDAV